MNCIFQRSRQHANFLKKKNVNKTRGSEHLEKCLPELYHTRVLTASAPPKSIKILMKRGKMCFPVWTENPASAMGTEILWGRLSCKNSIDDSTGLAQNAGPELRSIKQPCSKQDPSLLKLPNTQSRVLTTLVKVWGTHPLFFQESFSPQPTHVAVAPSHVPASLGYLGQGEVLREGSIPAMMTLSAGLEVRSVLTVPPKNRSAQSGRYKCPFGTVISQTTHSSTDLPYTNEYNLMER